MKKTVIITEDHITLIKNLRFEQFDESRYGVDGYSLWGGSYVYEDIAFLLGYANRVLRESQNDALGPVYEAEVQKYLDILADDFSEHLTDYEEILHQNCATGLKVGKYTKKGNEVFWTYVGKDTKRDIEKPDVIEKDWDMISPME